nr:ATP-binding protein [Streptomyces sp. NRRL S-118]
MAPRPDTAGPTIPAQRIAGPQTGPAQTADLRRFAFELPARAESVARARRLVRDRLAVWRVEGDVLDTATLVVSELFTNAVVHTASGRVVCELRDVGGRLRIAVQDEGCPAAEPRLRQVDAEERGRGLLLVEAMCGAWGAHHARHGAGWIVWAELALDAGAGHTPDAADSGSGSGSGSGTGERTPGVAGPGDSGSPLGVAEPC